MDTTNTRILVPFPPDAHPVGLTPCHAIVDSLIGDAPLSLDSVSPEILFFDSLDRKAYPNYRPAQERLNREMAPKTPRYGLWTDIDLLGRKPCVKDFLRLGTRLTQIQNENPDPLRHVTGLVRIGFAAGLSFPLLALCLSLLRERIPCADLYLHGSHPLTATLCHAFRYGHVTSDGPAQILCGPTPLKARLTDAPDLFLAPCLA